MLADVIQKDPEVGKVIVKCMSEGDMVPDYILNPLVEKRIKQSDCKVNGWIMEGFGYNKSQ
jgi:adenylate kinase